MPLDSRIVGATLDRTIADIDPRWTMAYAASLGDTLPAYFDTLRPDHLIAHPLFPVCFEWPRIVAMRALFRDSSLTDAEAMRGVHATHDVIIHRAIRPPARVTTRLQVAGIERRTPGAYQVTRLETVDSAGQPICTSWYGSIYRGVEVAGADRTAEAPMLPSIPEQSATTTNEITIPIAAGMAHTYTECARIFNPVHTDAAVARAAGLPAIILHGTATLALAVSRIIAVEAGNDPSRVTRIAGRFSAMVLMPSEVIVRIVARKSNRDSTGAGVFFEVQNNEGKLAIRDGFVGLSD
jgi:acyl dehydratase